MYRGFPLKDNFLFNCRNFIKNEVTNLIFFVNVEFNRSSFF